MEKPENKYQRGKIYKLISNETDKIYYGSTIEDVLTNRLSGHRSSYKRWLNGKYDYTSSFEIVKFDDCKIVLVENYPCNTKYELVAREQHHIDNNYCVDKCKSFTGLDKHQYLHKYYEENRDKLLQLNKQYRENNKDYYSKYKKEYIEHNREKLHQKFNCSCGGKYIYVNAYQHEKTEKHQAYLKSLENNKNDNAI